MRHAMALLLIGLSLAGCINDQGTDATVQEAEATDDRPTWTDEELLGQVNPNFTNEGGPIIQVDVPTPWGEPGDVTLAGTVDRNSALFLTLHWGEVCTSGFKHSERLIVNGTWEYIFTDLPMEEYAVTATAFGQHANGTLDLTVGSSIPAGGDVPSFRLGWEATMQIDYGSASDKEPVEDLVQVWSMASYDQYEATGGTDDCPETSHPGYLNVHDVMAAWEAQQDHTVTYSYSESFNSFSVERIDGEGNSLDAGEPPWWCYQRNGEYASQGISIERFEPGDVIAWDLGDCDTVMGGT